MIRIEVSPAIAAIRPAEQAGPAHDSGTMQQSADGRPAAIGNLQSAPRIAQSRAHHADFRVGVGISGEPAQRMGRHDRIVIEKEEIPAAGAGRGLIVGAGKAAIFRVADQNHFGKIADDHLGRPVFGRIIDDDRLNAHALRLIVQRFEAATQQFAAIPIGDADRDINRPIVGKIGHPGRPPVVAAASPTSVVGNGVEARRRSSLGANDIHVSDAGRAGRGFGRAPSYHARIESVNRE